MTLDLNAAVEDYRRRSRDQAAEVERLRGVLRDLKAQAEEAGTSRAARTVRAAQSDLDRADSALAALKREYARFRLREAIGQDPAFIETPLFDEVLLVLTSGGPARGACDPQNGRISLDTFRTLLLADLLLGQLIENARADRRAGVILDQLDERASTKSVLRQWAAMSQSDPYVSDVLRRAGEETSRFTRCLAQFLQFLDRVRITYEMKQRKADRLVFAFEDSRPAIQASNDWANVERVCGEDVRHLHGAFLGLEQAREELRHLREELNVELRNLMAAFIPRYLTYVLRQSRARRERLGLKSVRVRRLCRYLLDEVERTDFLLPRGSGLEIALPRLPRDIAGFRRVSSFVRFKRSVERGSTGEIPT